MPPIAKPIATDTFWMKISAMHRITPTIAIVVYWRFRYARAPSWTAPEMRTMSALPGDSASRERVVRTPYATAPIAQTSATITPWSVRKSLKGQVPPRLV